MGSLPVTLPVTLPLVLTAGGAEATTTILVSMSSLTTAANGLVTASTYLLETCQTKLVADLTKGGYHKVLPGQTYTTRHWLPVATNLRAWVIRIQSSESSILVTTTQQPGRLAVAAGAAV